MLSHMLLHNTSVNINIHCGNFSYHTVTLYGSNELVDTLISLYVCMYVRTDPLFDVMQTITEPTGDDTSASPTPGSDDGQEQTVKRGGQDVLNSRFKKRKPMKPTSRTSINNLVDNKVEYDEQYDRQVNNVTVH